MSAFLILSSKGSWRQAQSEVPVTCWCLVLPRIIFFMWYRTVTGGILCVKNSDCFSIYKVPLPCVASGSCTKTPGGSRAGPPALADYTPLQAPMVPGLIIHCVNEVRHRCWNTRVRSPNFDLFGELRFNGMIKSNSQNHKKMLFNIEVPANLSAIKLGYCTHSPITYSVFV